MYDKSKWLLTITTAKTSSPLAFSSSFFEASAASNSTASPSSFSTTDAVSISETLGTTMEEEQEEDNDNDDVCLTGKLNVGEINVVLLVKIEVMDEGQ